MSAKAQAMVTTIPMQDASLDIWASKYQLKTKNGEAVDWDIAATYQRVATALAQVEAKANRSQHMKDFLWALRNGAIPAGRITSNAGAEAHKPATSTINCTVSGTIDDSMNDILEKNHEAGLTLKAGCGIGYEFSTLRPRGAYVAGAGATTSGPLSFMDIFDRMCFTVSSAGGRRGAQMATFDVHHPDIIEFIQAKREDGRLRQFNLSLLITEDFINAVKNDEDWHLSFPVTQKEVKEEGLDLADANQFVYRDFPADDGYVTNADGLAACRIYHTLKAQFIWDTIMASTYDYAEPGFILIDKVNQMNNNWFCEDIRATNPCVTSDTWVQTSQGPRQVSELIGKSFTAMVDGQPHESGAEGFFKTADKDTVVLKTAEGYELKLTSDHRVRRVSAFTRFRTETEWCAAGELRQGDRVLLQDQRKLDDWEGALNEDQGYLLGLLVGDGALKQDKAVLSVWQQAQAVNGGPAAAGPSAIMRAAETAARSLPHRGDFSGWQKISGRNEYRMSTAALKQLAQDMGMSPGNKSITKNLEKASSAAYRGFLRGFFDADGSVQGNQQKGVSVRLAQSDLQRLKATQRMLLRLGIVATTATLPDGKGGRQAYSIQSQHELVITGENLRRFADEIGFADTDKQGQLETLLSSYQRKMNRERFVARVTAIEAGSVEAVYDVQVPGINTFDANGFHAHNCGEQPLPPYGSCLLGSVNLTMFVDYPFTDKASFNYEKYRQVVGIFTRMLDNVVEINGLPLPEQRHEITYKRRHGMGILGLGSTLAMLRMPYGSAQSVTFTEDVVREMAVEGWRQSLALAEEKGPAPIMNDDFEVTPKLLTKCPQLEADGYKSGDQVKGRILHAQYSLYMQQIAELEPELVAALAEKGGRFTHHTSIAPTGTISLSLANNASNGIEPSFSHHYSRNIIREGRKTKDNVDVFSFELLAYRHMVNPGAMPFSDDEDKRLPSYFTTSDDVTPTQHVDIQAAAQKWVDSSISKTANVPTDFPFQDFKDIYMYAYDSGLKGCTTFRFNPEVFQGVLVKESDLENTLYEFTLDDGSKVTFKGNEKVEYDGEIHTAANLFDALKEGTYGKY